MFCGPKKHNNTMLMATETLCFISHLAEKHCYLPENLSVQARGKKKNNTGYDNKTPEL